MIHYHGTPLSGGLRTKMALAARHGCVSFAHPDDIGIVAEVCQSFILDNGAYSLRESGAEYDSMGFVDWASRWLKHPACDWALVPDVINPRPGEGAAEVARRNDSLLNLAPDKHQWVPIWHLHEPIERLERLCSEWPRVALGSSGQYADPGSDPWWRRMSEAMNAICDDEGRPPCKLHGLRMLDPNLFSWLPLSSADSTNCARNIGMDSRWKGTYTPVRQATRAIILMERIEAHASATTWNPEASDTARNFELIG